MSENEPDIDIFKGEFIRLSYWPQYEETQAKVPVLLEFDRTSIVMDLDEYSELVSAVEKSKGVIPIKQSSTQESKD